jgi:Calcineurin-like phosphoesterase
MSTRSLGLTLLALLSAGLVACGSAPLPPAAGPVPVPPGVVRFIAGGDSRNDGSHVIPWAFAQAKARGASAFFFLGDMEMTPQLDAAFASELGQLDPVMFLPALGNHEIKQLGFASIGRAAAERAFKKRFLGTARTPVQSSLGDRVVYSIDLAGGVHFIALDNVSQNGFGADQLAWLEADLGHARSTTSTRHIIVGMHKPLAHNGATTHSMDADGATAVKESDEALALFVKYKVSLILACHVHQYTRFIQAGIPTYITGGLGAPLTPAGPDAAFHHFLQLDVTEEGIHVDVVRFDGTPTIGVELDDKD